MMRFSNFIRVCPLFRESFYNIWKSRVAYSSNSPRCLKEVICSKISCARSRVKEFRSKHNRTQVGCYSVDQVYSGMRDMIAMVCDTSEVHPDKGVRFRGRTIDDIFRLIPTAEENGQPLPEGLLWLLCTGDIPTAEETTLLSNNLIERSNVPDSVLDLIKNLPKDLHPIAQLSCAVCALSQDSELSQAIAKGEPKDLYWESVYEDSMNLIGKLPVVCAAIYNNMYKSGKGKTKADPSLDWTGNYCNMMTFSDTEFAEMMRLYLVLYSDHEGGNVSAHATHLVGSALANPYLAYAAGINGLSGPLHGFTNQQVLRWIQKMKIKLGSEADDKTIKEYVEKIVKCDEHVPGFGHAVLRITDPRFTAMQNFAKDSKACNDSVGMVDRLAKIVPPALKTQRKVKNPYPNIDLASGSVLTAYGMTEMNYYPVIFALARSLGTMSQLIWARAFEHPIERPKSISTKTLMNMVGQKCEAPPQDCKDDKSDKNAKNSKNAKKSK